MTAKRYGKKLPNTSREDFPPLAPKTTWFKIKYHQLTLFDYIIPYVDPVCKT